jgi:hypothetical protein
VLLEFDNGDEEAWFYLSPVNYNKKKKWAAGASAPMQRETWLKVV